MAKIIGANVRAYREEKGWSQTVAGSWVDLSQSNISKVEHGYADLAAENAWVLCNHFGCRMEDLLRQRRKRHPPSDAEAEPDVPAPDDHTP